MHPATLHGVGVITKLYFVISAAFKESMILTRPRGHSIPYILAAIESTCMTSYRPLVVTVALSSTVSEILLVLYAQNQFFHTHSYSS